MTNPHTTTTVVDDLRVQVAALTQPTRRAIMRDPDPDNTDAPRTVRAVIPSLLDQLDDAAEPGSESSGSAGVAGSRPPTGEDALVVRLDIQAGVARRRTAARLRPVDDTAAALTGLAEHLIAAGDQDPVAELADLVAAWVRQARGALHIAYSARELLGIPCPLGTCRRTWIDHGQDGREAALIIVASDTGRIRAAQCRSCGAVWWRGDPLDGLGEYVRGMTAAIDRAVMRDRSA